MQKREERKSTRPSLLGMAKSGAEPGQRESVERESKTKADS
jgi:hypothetical protein